MVLTLFCQSFPRLVISKFQTSYLESDREARNEVLSLPLVEVRKKEEGRRKKR
ncbi:MAG: hypothetical protein F6K48_26450 [Okeania sp. SIO3H1]|uniref:hypothetical protein n=1 Tax=Okeania sp. SIO1I7 TaxID=2607772 RepID=UPI0013C71177|nr:hypothetical protein [Okeania sp. SIO1I7]NEN92249.1 hypothetical protein [Okeania sp. SIO3H1]NET27224.1 hypothetical protein [Okeania sp. SIO1I7]